MPGRPGPPLSAQQQAAVTAPAGPLVVRAGAGTGKTTVIVERVVHLIVDCGLPPSAILVVTFSRRARQELVDRLAARLPDQGRRVAVTTLHALGRRIIARWPAAAGYRPVRLAVYGPADRALVLDEALRDLGVPPLVGEADRLLAAVDTVRLGLPPPCDADWLGDLDLTALAAHYENRLRRRNALDFVAMVTLPPRLLDARPDVLALLQAAYAAILVDEAQDLSADQIGLLLRLARGHRHLTVVGDAAQAIYGFRGGDPRLLTDFATIFIDARTIVLDVSYRATAPLVAVGNALVAGLPGGHALTSAVGAGPPVVAYRARDAGDEAAWVARQLRRLHTDGAIAHFGEAAVLSRTHAQAGPLVTALRAVAIPCQPRRSVVALAADRDTADVLAYLRLLLNPDDIIALRRVVTTTERGLGLLAAALAEGTAVTLADVQTLAARLDAAFGHTGAGSQAARLAAFLAPIERLRSPAGRLSIGLLDALLDAVGYTDWVRRQPCAAARLAAIDAVRRLVDDAGDDPGCWLADLLADEAAPAPSEDAVAVSSIHGVKGAEYPVVFVVGLDEGVLPDRRTLADPAALRAELAVLYVAVTRARHRLYLSHCATRRQAGSTRTTRPSRFLVTLPADQLVAG
ncbi:MAG: ATP-dependent helicase [Chloroflexi bacterium]|nr:ATP-dependent helicase [Chloroflexota bacterium]